MIGSNRMSAIAPEVELDMTPIMNVMVILIPILVSMAVFTTYATLQFSLPPSAGVGAGGPTKEDLRLTLVVDNQQVKATLGDQVLAQMAGPVQMQETLPTLRSKLSRSEEAVIAFEDGVEFERVVDVMDACRASGFTKIALAEGEGTSHATQHTP